MVRRVDAVQQGLEIPLDDAERRSQLVRDVGEQPAALHGIPFEPASHLVEGARQATDLAGAALWHADVVVASLDPAGCFDQVADRCGRTPYAAAQQQGDDDHEDGEQRTVRGRHHRSQRTGQEEEDQRRPTHGDQDQQRREDRHPRQKSPAHPPPRGSLPPTRRPGLPRGPPRRTLARSCPTGSSAPLTAPMPPVLVGVRHRRACSRRRTRSAGSAASAGSARSCAGCS